ncbi:XRE family transcriptional regulator [Candidatus Poribacteria bacterium]|nr:XRE family transcriptional regulator [Candidatus Poribacteria bacterium]
MCDDVKFEKSSGNVFKNIGFSDEEAEALSFRTKLTFEVFTLLKKSQLKHAKAAKLLAVDLADILKLKNGDDDHFSLAHLADFRDRLKGIIEIRVQLSENDDMQNATDGLGVGR